MNATACKAFTLGMFTLLLLFLGYGRPQFCNASDVGETTALPVDVALPVDSTLHGILLDRNGAPIVQAPVTLYRDQSQPRTATTDRQGRFAFPSAPSGVAVLSFGEQLSVVRLWAPHTGPPRARPVAVLYSSGVVRGQACAGPAAPCGAAGCFACSGGMGPVAYGRHGKAPNAGRFGGLTLPTFHPVRALRNPVTLGVLMSSAVVVPLLVQDEEILPLPAS